jgi:hypothetical protein
MSKDSGIRVTQTNGFIIPLTTGFGPDRPSPGDAEEDAYDDGIRIKL